MARTPVPEAAVDKDRDSLPNERQICAAPRAREWAIDVVPVAEPVEGGTERKLARGVALGCSLHPLANGWRRRLRATRRTAAGFRPTR